MCRDNDGPSVSIYNWSYEHMVFPIVEVWLIVLKFLLWLLRICDWFATTVATPSSTFWTPSFCPTDALVESDCRTQCVTSLALPAPWCLQHCRYLPTTSMAPSLPQLRSWIHRYRPSSPQILPLPSVSRWDMNFAIEKLIFHQRASWKACLMADWLNVERVFANKPLLNS